MADLTTYIDHGMTHTEILLSGDPDAGYHYFWMNFKGSVTNAASVSKNPDLRALDKELTLVSDRLNILKDQAKFDQIGQEIQHFLKEFLWHILSEDKYHIAIASTNLKRWIRYTEIPIPGTIRLNPLDDLDLYYLYFLHRLDSTYSKLIYRHGSLTSAQGLLMILRLAVSDRSAKLMNNLLEYYPEWTVDSVWIEYKVRLPATIRNGAKAIKQLSL